MYVSFEAIDWAYMAWILWSGLACLVVAGAYRSLRGLKRNIKGLRKKSEKDMWIINNLEIYDHPEPEAPYTVETMDKTQENAVKRSSFIFDCSRVSFDTLSSGLTGLELEKPSADHQTSSVSTNAETDISSKTLSGCHLRTEASSLSLDTVEEKPQICFSDCSKDSQPCPLNFACFPSEGLLYAEVITEEAQKIMSDFRSKYLPSTRSEVPESSPVKLARASSFTVNSGRPKQRLISTLRPSSAKVKLHEFSSATCIF